MLIIYEFRGLWCTTYFTLCRVLLSVHTLITSDIINAHLLNCRFKEIYKMRVFGYPVVVVNTPDAAKFILTSPSRHIVCRKLSWRVFESHLLQHHVSRRAKWGERIRVQADSWDFLRPEPQQASPTHEPASQWSGRVLASEGTCECHLWVTQGTSHNIANLQLSLTLHMKIMWSRAKNKLHVVILIKQQPKF